MQSFTQYKFYVQMLLTDFQTRPLFTVCIEKKPSTLDRGLYFT